MAVPPPPRAQRAAVVKKILRKYGLEEPQHKLAQSMGQRSPRNLTLQQHEAKAMVEIPPCSDMKDHRKTITNSMDSKLRQIL